MLQTSGTPGPWSGEVAPAGGGRRVPPPGGGQGAGRSRSKCERWPRGGRPATTFGQGVESGQVARLRSGPPRPGDAGDQRVRPRLSGPAAPSSNDTELDVELDAEFDAGAEHDVWPGASTRPPGTPSARV